MSSSESEQSQQLTLLEPGRTERNYWTDLFRFRELFFVLAWRDVKVRYKQAAIGVAWAIIRPLLAMTVFTVIFGRIAKLPSEGDTPYVLMVYSAMIAWFLFSTILTEASNSLIGNANLVSKIYFPRMIVPCAASVVSLVDFMINLAILFILALYLKYPPTIHILFLPVFVFAAILAGIGPAILVSALNVKYRDFRYIIPFVVQMGLYITPVGFSASIIPEKYNLLYHLNPMVAVINGFRWCLLGGETPLNWQGMGISASVVVVFLFFGIRYFRYTERSFADYI